MVFIKECFEEHRSALTEKLTAAGFSTDQARQFLPEITSGLLSSIQNTGVDKIIEILLSDDPSQLLNSINVDAIAKNLGMNSAQVRSGIEAIAPVMSQVFLQKSNEIIEVAAALAWTSPRDVTSSVKNFLV